VLKAVFRAGRYFRVFKPDWTNPLDTRPSLGHGGRWNGPGVFGALYLAKTIAVAAANARRQHRGRAIGLFDLKPGRRPHLLTVTVPHSLHLDVVSQNGVRALKLPANFPWQIDHATCQAIGLKAYHEPRLRGIAARSAAECSAADWLGEELAWFDRSPALREVERQTFARWYPDVYPQ
jgi:hypothetical protein